MTTGNSVQDSNRQMSSAGPFLSIQEHAFALLRLLLAIDQNAFAWSQPVEWLQLASSLTRVDVAYNAFDDSAMWCEGAADYDSEKSKVLSEIATRATGFLYVCCALESMLDKIKSDKIKIPEVRGFPGIAHRVSGFLKGRRIEQVVHLAHPIAALVDAADLDRQEEAHRGAGRRMHALVDRGGQVVAQTKKPRARRHQLVAQFGEPARVGEVAGGDHRDAFALGPGVQVLQVERATGRSRQVGVNVQVRHEGHGANLAKTGWGRGTVNSAGPSSRKTETQCPRHCSAKGLFWQSHEDCVDR